MNILKKIYRRFLIERIALTLFVFMLWAFVGQSLAVLEGVNIFLVLFFFLLIVSFCLFRSRDIFILTDSDVRSESDIDGLTRTLISHGADVCLKLCSKSKFKRDPKFKIPREIVALSISGAFFLVTIKWSSYAPQEILRADFSIKNPANYSVGGELLIANREDSIGKNNKSFPKIEEETGQYASRIYGKAPVKPNDWLDYRYSPMTNLVMRRYYQEQ